MWGDSDPVNLLREMDDVIFRRFCSGGGVGTGLIGMACATPVSVESCNVSLSVEV